MKSNKNTENGQWNIAPCLFILCPSPPADLLWFPEHVRLIAVISVMIGSKCITAHYSCVWPKGRLENISPLSSAGCELCNSPEGLKWLSIRISEKNQVQMSSLLFSLHSGGCLIRQPVLSMPSVAFCLACAVWPTSLCFPASVGSRFAAQTMVRQPLFVL